MVRASTTSTQPLRTRSTPKVEEVRQAFRERVGSATNAAQIHHLIGNLTGEFRLSYRAVKDAVRDLLPADPGPETAPEPQGRPLIEVLTPEALGLVEFDVDVTVVEPQRRTLRLMAETLEAAAAQARQTPGVQSVHGVVEV